MSKQHIPHVSEKENYPEITIKAFFLGAVLSMILSAANAYLGLFAGMTVSASIPAAVLSMFILRFFKNSNILENNIVQTSASAGESLAAGVIFTFPALVLMGYWTEFNYWETVFIALSGGVLGVLFTIPLRNALIVQQNLQFPEGVATSEVLKTGEKGGKSVRFLLIGAIGGAFIKFAEGGLKLWTGISEGASLVANKLYLYFGMNLSPALIGVGYIVGIRIAFLVFAGGVISWYIAIPGLVSFNGLSIESDTSAVDFGYGLWSSQIRYLGVGAMVIGGLWALVKLRSSVQLAIRSGLDAFRKKKSDKHVPRTERDAPMHWVIITVVVMIVPIFFIYQKEIGHLGMTGLMAIIMVIAGFLFAAVAGYMAGLVGSSNNPISGVTIATILTSSLILLLFFGTGSVKGPAAAILIGAVVCCAAAIAGDNMQDLKAGYILGATPYKQQIMQMVGVVSAAIVMPLVLQLLLKGYGFGPASTDHPDSLAAPQATLMESVAKGVFSGDLPWTMVYIGVGIGLAIIILDSILEARKSDLRVPVLAVAVGIYLPFELDSAIMFGGLIAWAVNRYQQKRKTVSSDFLERKSNSDNAGLLFASGLITGEALVGILLAIPVAVYGTSDVLAISDEAFGSIPGVIIVLIISFLLYNSAVKEFSKPID